MRDCLQEMYDRLLKRDEAYPKLLSERDTYKNQAEKLCAKLKTCLCLTLHWRSWFLETLELHQPLPASTLSLSRRVKPASERRGTLTVSMRKL